MYVRLYSRRECMRRCKKVRDEISGEDCLDKEECVLLYLRFELLLFVLIGVLQMLQSGLLRTRHVA